MQLPNLHINLSSARSVHVVYQSVSPFPRIFAYGVDFDQIDDSLPRYRWDGIFPGKLQDDVSVRVPHHNGEFGDV